MSPEQYVKFKQSLKETQEKTARTLASIDSTLQGVKDTLQKIKENEENIDKFKADFGNAMTKLAQQIAFSMNVDPNMMPNKQTADEKPRVLPVKDVVKRMLEHKEILIITGAGVSAPSGIPTFRGINGLYDKKFEWEGVAYEPEQFITKQFYDRHPEAIWQWIQEIYKMAINLKPNKIHQLIDLLAKCLNAQGKKVTVVTQNVDDFHFRPQKQEYKYYAVHGNVKQIRCDKDHIHAYSQFRDQIIKEGKVAYCPNCKEALRPHVLFFDETYGPLYGGEVKGKKFPFVFVIGSSLSTGLCRRLTYQANQVVQINPKPVIEVGKVYQFKQDTATTLADFLKQMKEIK